MRLRDVRRAADGFLKIGAIHFLRHIADLARPRDRSVRPQHVLSHSQLVVAQARNPTDQNLFGLLEGHADGIGNLAAVFPEVNAALHGRRLRNVQIQRPVPEAQLLAHVLEHASARIIPKISPVHEAIRVELTRGGIAQERRPVHTIGRKIRRKQRRPRPLRLIGWRVPMHLHADRGDLAHTIPAQTIRSREKLTDVRHMPSGASLMADLDYVTPAVTFVDRPHLLGLWHAQRHSLFEIHVLAGRYRIAELLRMKMLRRRDDYGVHGRIVQQTAIIRMNRRVGCDPRSGLQASRKDVGESRDFRVGAGADMIDQLHATVARAENANADAVVRPEHTDRPCSQGPGETVRDLPNEIPAGIHVFSVYQGTRPDLFQVLVEPQDADPQDRHAKNR